MDPMTNNEVKSFNKWRVRARNRLPELSAKVFELRYKSYPGCGFHWSLEKQLGFCINNICNYDRRYADWMENISIQVVFEGLIKEIKKIEAEISNSPKTSTA